MSTNLEARAWVQVRADALRENYLRIGQALAPDVRILPMVKADAYGLGVAEVVSCLEALDPWGFGVATVAEGAALRGLGVTRPVVVCSPAPPDQYVEAVEHDLQLSLSSIAAIGLLEEACERTSRSADFHVDVDTGMGRSGFDWREADSWLPAVASTVPGLRWVGIYTHLHSADEGTASVEEQWRRLQGVLESVPGLAARGDDTGVEPTELMVHVLNSAGVFRAPSYARALVRPGIFLYGGEVGAGQPSPCPVASLYARVVHVKDVPPGSTLGYGATYRAKSAERWATLSIGYGDGFPRALGNRGSALLHGRRVPIIGRISMDVTVVNITGLEAVRVGDVATLLGEDADERITVDEVAAEAGTISYEILTGLTARLPRMWIEGEG